MLTKAKDTALEHKAIVSWTSFLDAADDYLDGPSQESWRKIFTPLIRGVVISQGERWGAVLGRTFDVQNLFARDWFNRYILKFAQEISKTTKNYVAGIVNQGITEGWSVPTMQDHLTDLFTHMATNDPTNLDWYTDRLPAYRTEMIARTETIRASNAGTNELFSEWGVRQQEWLATKDDRTRDDHAEADGQIVNMGAAFYVGGEWLDFPGDPNGSPENTINCRCTTIPVLEGME